MDCPNCGKEAINVGGRYVCLDCGIELSSSNTPPPTSAPADLTPATPETSINQPEIVIPAEDPGASGPIPPPPGSENQGTTATPVKDEYMTLIENPNENSGVVDFSDSASSDLPPVTLPPQDGPISQNNFPVADTKTPDGALENLSGPNPSTGISDTPTVETPTEITQTGPVQSPPEDIAFQNQPSAEPPAPDKSSSNPGNENYFQPASLPISGEASTPAQSTIPPVSQQPSDNPAPIIVEPDKPPVEGWPENIVPPTVQKHFEKDTGEQPANPTELTAREANSLTEPPIQGEFPSTPDLINPQSPPADQPNAFNTLPEDNKNPVENVEPPVQPSQAPPAPPEFSSGAPLTYEDLASKENRPPNIDDLLKKYSGAPDDTAQAPTFKPDYPSNNFVEEISKERPKSKIPGGQNIPSPDSVFGPLNPMDENKETYNASGPRKSRKTLILMFVILGATLMAGLAIYLGLTAFRPQQNNSEVLGEERFFEVSDKVADTMDKNLNLEVSFSQEIDFSETNIDKNNNLTIQGNETLRELISYPLKFAGIWQGDVDGNLSLEATLNGRSVKKKYIAAEKSTYDFASEFNIWNRSDGQKFSIVPDLFSAQNKGNIFYLTKASEVVADGTETENNKEYRRYKITPKSDLIQNVVMASSSLLEEIVFEGTTAPGFKISVLVDDENRIRKIVAQGAAEINSDVLDGRISIKSTALYSYKDIKIVKP